MGTLFRWNHSTFDQVVTTRAATENRTTADIVPTLEMHGRPALSAFYDLKMDRITAY